MVSPDPRGRRTGDPWAREGNPNPQDISGQPFVTQHISASDLQDLLRTGPNVQSTVYEFGSAQVIRTTKDDLTILTVVGIYNRAVSREIERLALQGRGNLALDLRDVKVNPVRSKRFDGSVLGLLKSLQAKFQARRREFVLWSPPPELVDLLKLTGTLGGYTLVGGKPGPDAPGPPSPAPARSPRRQEQHEVVKKRIVNLTHSLERTVSLEKGLDSAQKCVQRLLPQEPPRVAGYEFAFSYQSSEKVGGDFFDLIELDTDTFGILIGDVSGHGIDAALLMGISKKVLSIRAKEEGKGSPRRALCRANLDLASDFRRYSFVTVLYGILELGSGRFTFCRAGHEPPIVFAPELGAHAIETDGMPLGTELQRQFEALLEEKTVHVPPGGLLFFCTDGLPERKNGKAALYSRDRLVFELGRVDFGRSCQGIQEIILAGAEDFADGIPQEDDITTILVRRKGRGR